LVASAQLQSGSQAASGYAPLGSDSNSSESSASDVVDFAVDVADFVTFGNCFLCID
jgi:hypothetical protein